MVFQQIQLNYPLKIAAVFMNCPFMVFVNH